jgi:hypothetical protein
MDTESFFFIGVLCSLSAAATSLLPLRKVRISNYILSPGEILIMKERGNYPGRHSREGGNPELYAWTGFRLKDCRNDNIKMCFRGNDESVDILRRASK